MKDLALALLRVQDVNVLVVDWIYSASFAYNLVVQSYKEVAVQISVLLSQLQVGEGSGLNLQQQHFPFRIKLRSCFKINSCRSCVENTDRTFPQSLNKTIKYLDCF